jgi:glutathione S-transferase
MKGQHPDIEERFPYLKQWVDRISQRPAVIAGMQIPKLN